MASVVPVKATPQLAALGGTAAAVGAALCCIGAMLVVTRGIGAYLASRSEPLRTLFTILTLALLALLVLGFYAVDGR